MIIDHIYASFYHFFTGIIVLPFIIYKMHLDFPNFLLLQDSSMILLFLGLFVILEIQPLLGVQVLQEYNLHIILKEIQLCRILLMICEGQVFHLN